MQSKEMFGNAKWVSPLGRTDTPYIRGEFTLEKEIQKAEITICGLGWFELYLNGKKVSDDLFTPANTDYHRTENQSCLFLFGEELSHRIYCMQYEITSYLTKENCIGVLLGPGWYKTDGIERDYGFEFSYGHVKLCYRIVITYADGTTAEVLSDERLKWAQSPIVKSHLRYGESYDYYRYTKENWNLVGYDDTMWEDLTVVDAPETEYYIQDFLPDRVIRHITPTLICETNEGYIYDMGENITGTPVIKAKDTKVCKILMSCSERLNPDGTLEEYTTHKQNSSFITDGADRLYKLKFCWYGFRYAMVSKNAEIIDCEVIHTDVKVTSSFQSDSAVLNWLYDAYIRTQLDNIHCCIPSDCPHLEKQGYTGDGQLTAETCMMMTDSRKMYEKWLADISDCQDTISGHVQYCAPYLRSGGGPGGWGCAIIAVPYLFYKTYGDKLVLEKFVPKALRYFEYLEAHSEKDLVVRDQPGLWCLGDWCAPTMGFNQLDAMVLPAPLVNTYFYIRSLNQVMDACRIIGKEGLIPDLEKTRAIKMQAIVDHYYDPETGDFAGNVQGANAFAVDLGLGDERTLAHIVENYRKIKTYDTGIFATDIVTRLLFQKGYDQDAFDLLTSEGPYSFFNFMQHGCTTLPEYWTFRRSQNHPMYGAVTKYLFMYLLGIVNDNVAYRNVLIEPRFVNGLNRAKGSILTESGRISVEYTKNQNEIQVEVEIPEHVSARFRYRGKDTPLKPGTNKMTLAL